MTKMNAQPTVRFVQRKTPSTKSNRPRGSRPVKRMANQAMTAATASVRRLDSELRGSGLDAAE